MENKFLETLREEHEAFQFHVNSASERKRKAQQELGMLHQQILEEEMKISWAEDDLVKYSKLVEASHKLLEFYDGWGS